MLDLLSSPKTKVFAQLCHIITRDPQACNLAVSGTKNDPGTLEACQSPYTNALSCVFEFLQQILCQFTGTNRQHVVQNAHQCKCPVQCSQTDTDHAHLNKAMFVQLARQKFLPTSRRCPETQHGLYALSKPHVCHPSESSGSSLQVVVRTAVRLLGLQR